MLPPVDEQTIRDNPEFAKLYRMLLEKALNPDGSTKHDNSIPEGDAVQQVSRYEMKNTNGGLASVCGTSWP